MIKVEKIETKIIEKDGKQYYVRHCPNCKAELLFNVNKKGLELHCACAKCGHSFSLRLD